MCGQIHCTKGENVYTNPPSAYYILPSVDGATMSRADVIVARDI